MPQSLDAYPRIALAHLPTPLEPLPRLSAELGGPEIWVKRDDCTGLATGGNKTRKLEFLLGAALEDGVDTVITLGGVQSNHARQTAAACARLGLRCQLVLPRVVPRGGPTYDESGNILLDRLLGAEVYVVTDEAEAIKKVQELTADAEKAGRRIVVHPPGGSTPVGSLGYVAAALELNAQDTSFERVYLAASTGGTLAGLAAGASMASWSTEFTGVCVAGNKENMRRDVDALLVGLGELLTLAPGLSDSVRLDGNFLGDGYGIPNAAALEAVRLCADKEGLLIDPVYTGKAMAALIAHVREGRAGAGPILFWHTGGAASLFAYREELSRSLT